MNNKKKQENSPKAHKKGIAIQNISKLTKGPNSSPQGGGYMVIKFKLSKFTKIGKI